MQRMGPGITLVVPGRGSMGSIGWYIMKVQERWHRIYHLLIWNYDVFISKTTLPASWQSVYTQM